jgi:MFS family permease
MALALPVGRLSDLTRRRTVFIAGIFLLAITAGVTALATSLPAVIAFRLGQGIGSACLFATTLAIINEVFPSERRGQMLGLSVAATYAGLSLGPVLGGFITHYLGWRSVFVFLMVFGILTGVVAVVCLPRRRTSKEASRPQDGELRVLNGLAVAIPASHPQDGELHQPLPLPFNQEASRPQDGELRPRATQSSRQHAGKGPQVSLRRRMDPLGILFYAAAAIFLALGLNLVPGSLFGWLGLVLGAVALLVFIRHENRAPSPLVAPALFKNGPNFLLSNLSAMFNYCAIFAVSYLFSIYLQQAMGLSAAASGLVLITSPLMQTFITPFSGRLSDRYSPFRLASLGMGICAVGLISLVFVTFTSSLAHVIVSLLTLGVGFGIFSPPNTNAILALSPRQHSGVASSFVSTMRNSGQMMSMAIIAIVTTLTLGQTVITDASADSIAEMARICCIIFTVFCLVGIFTSLQRRSHEEA